MIVISKVYNFLREIKRLLIGALLLLGSTSLQQLTTQSANSFAMNMQSQPMLSRQALSLVSRSHAHWLRAEEELLTEGQIFRS